MIRPAMLRTRALLLAALYLAVPAGLAGVRPCPHHGPGGEPADVAVHAAPADAANAHDHGAGHGHGHGRGAEPQPPAGHGAEHREAGGCAGPGGDEHEPGHGGCECIGACTTPAPVLGAAGAAPAAIGAPVLPALPTAVPAAESDATPQHLVPHVLPWSLGPPVDPS